MTTNEIEKIITEFCDQPLNFYEKAEGVEWMRNMLTTLTQKHEEEKAAMLNRIENLLRVGADPLTVVVLERGLLSKTDVITE